MSRLKDKVMVITGAANGIGKSTSLIAAKHGAKIAVTDIQSTDGQVVVEEILRLGGQAHYWNMDTTNEEQVIQTVSNIEEFWGPVDVLVNNAGVAGLGQPTHETQKEDWLKVLDVNLTGCFLCTKHIVPSMMKSRGGSIVNISSVYGMVCSPNTAAYSASKGAIRSMTKADALTYAEYHIRVNSIHPGHIWTKLLENYGQQLPQGSEAFKKELETLYPLGRLGTPEDVAKSIVFLASDEAQFITGSELIIDGGYTAK